MGIMDIPEEKIEPEEEPLQGAKPATRPGAVDHHPGDAFKKVFGNIRNRFAAKKPAQAGGEAVTEAHEEGDENQENVEAGNGKTMNPDMRMRAFFSPPLASIPENTPRKVRLLPDAGKTRKAYWDVAAALSLVINAVLVGVLIIMFGQIKNLKATVNELLGGLYGNFVEMDKATISTTIPVEAQIPISFSLPVQQNTTVKLTQDVPLIGARVVINSGGLSINAPANVTLPSGTDLPIALNLDIPVQLSIPISLQIPVAIPMNQTQLHAPFTGLQQTIRPLYCTLNKNAQYPEGVYICAEHDTPVNAVAP